MPVISVYRHGMTCGVPPAMNSHQRALRGEVGGWSDGATRRNTRFLYSIVEPELTGFGYAFTLTIRDCPPDSRAWARLRNNWIRRMERLDMIRLHWVTEWQRRGVPHLHGAIWFPDNDFVRAFRIVSHWVDLAQPYGASHHAQHYRDINGPVGWFQYLSKHAARGVKHYQRSSENIPQAWREKTGRMWGHIGHWPVCDSMKINLQDQHGDGGYFAFRRLVRSWRIADARESGDATRIRLARTCLSSNQINVSRVRGMSEWVPEGVQLSFLANLATRGYAITA